jgi:hypothetical protein
MAAVKSSTSLRTDAWEGFVAPSAMAIRSPIRRLNGYTEITSTTGTGRQGVYQRVFRMGLRVSF